MRTSHLTVESVDRSDAVRATIKVLALVLFNLAVIYMAWTVVSDKADLNRPAHAQTLGTNG